MKTRFEIVLSPDSYCKLEHKAKIRHNKFMRAKKILDLFKESYHFIDKKIKRNKDNERILIIIGDNKNEKRNI